jgi:hypothetical protein
VIPIRAPKHSFSRPEAEKAKKDAAKKMYEPCVHPKSEQDNTEVLTSEHDFAKKQMAADRLMTVHRRLFNIDLVGKNSGTTKRLNNRIEAGVN